MSSTIRLSSTSPTSGSIATDTPTPRKRGRPKGSKRATTIQSSALKAISTTVQKSDTPKLKDLLTRLFSSQSTLSIMHQESSGESSVLQGLVFQALLKFQDSISGPQEIHVDRGDVSALKELKTILKETETPFYKNSLSELFDTVIATTEEGVKPNKKLKLDNPKTSPSSTPSSPSHSPPLNPRVIDQIQITTQSHTPKLQAIEKAYAEVEDYLLTHPSSDYFDKFPADHPHYHLRFFLTDAVHQAIEKTSQRLLSLNPRYYLLKYFSDPESIRLATLKESPHSCSAMQTKFLNDYQSIKQAYNDNLNKFKPYFVSKGILIPKFRHSWPHFDPKTSPTCEHVGANPMHSFNFATHNYIIFQTSKKLLIEAKNNRPNIYQNIIKGISKETNIFFTYLAYTLLVKADYDRGVYLCLKTSVDRPTGSIIKSALINHDSFEFVNGCCGFRLSPNEPFYTKRCIDSLTDKEQADLYLKLKTYNLDINWKNDPTLFLLTRVANAIKARYLHLFEGYLLTSQKNATPGPLKELLAGTDPAEIETRHASILTLDS